MIIEKPSVNEMITIGTNVFINCNFELSIYFPDITSVTKYKSANNWSSYLYKIKINPNTPDNCVMERNYTGEHYHLKTKHYFEYIETCIYCRSTYFYGTEVVICPGPPCMIQGDMFSLSDIESHEHNELCMDNNLYNIQYVISKKEDYMNIFS